ncbi:transmembrane protein, putative, partial [Rhizoctonia solani AG-3 Rhs1AP]
MKLASLLLAAPVVLTMVAADPRPTGGPDKRVLDRWRFARQDESTSAAAGGGAAASTPAVSTPAVTPTSSARETSSAAAPTSTTPAPTPTPTTTSTSTTPQEQPTSTSSPTSQQPQQPTSTPPTSERPAPTTSTSTSQQQQPTSNGAVTPPASSAAPQTSQTPTTTSFSLSTPPPTTAVISTTDQSGRIITSVVVITQTPHSVAVAPTATETSTEKKGTNQSTVIGLAVTGSIAGLLIILLIVWKLTGKRFSDLEDNDDDAIKWPELNKDSAAMTPIPARPSTRAAGAETDTLGTDFDRQSAANSAADLSYQPYSDDPGYGARPAYYDPYGGAPGATKPYPSPPGSHDGDHKTWGASADAAQYYDAPRGQSPGPNAIARGMSPGPGVVYDTRVASPAPPSMAYADPVGRTGSPGPAGYGYAAGYAPADPYSTGRNSPGPNMAYQPEMDPYGRRSPGPGMAYNGSVGRVGSPGPGQNPAYR